MEQYDQQQAIPGEGGYGYDDSQQQLSYPVAKPGVEDRSGHELERERCNEAFPPELHRTPPQQHTGVSQNGRPVYSTDAGITYGDTRMPLVEEGAHKKKGVTEKVKDALHTVKDTISGPKKPEISNPTSLESATVNPIASPTTHGTKDDHEKVGCLEKVKDLITGQKTNQGSGTGYANNDVNPHLATPGGAAPLSSPTQDYVATRPYSAQGVERRDYGLTPQEATPMPMGDGHGSEKGMHNRSRIGGEGWPQPVHPSQAPKAGRHHPDEVEWEGE
eukprot:c27576_g1_i3 orf=228-1052(+)